MLSRKFIRSMPAYLFKVGSTYIVMRDSPDHRLTVKCWAIDEANAGKWKKDQHCVFQNKQQSGILFRLFFDKMNDFDSQNDFKLK